MITNEGNLCYSSPLLSEKCDESLSQADLRAWTQPCAEGIPLVAVSSDVNQRVNKWVVNTADGTDGDESHRPPNGVAGRRSTNDQKAEGEQQRREGKESLCFLSCALSNARDRKHFLFHTPKHHIVPPPSVSSLCYQTQITEIICQISWVDVCGRALSLITGFCDREGWEKKKMQITYHTPHTSLKLIFRLSVFFFSFPSSLSSLTGLCC